MPFGLKGFYDLEEGLACAKASGKPVLIDFKGHFCSNCKRMEAAVWSDPQVLNTLRNDYVIVALYTDDRTKLPEEEWYTSRVDGKVKKTIGQQNIDYEIDNVPDQHHPPLRDHGFGREGSWPAQRHRPGRTELPGVASAGALVCFKCFCFLGIDIHAKVLGISFVALLVFLNSPWDRTHHQGFLASLIKSVNDRS